MQLTFLRASDGTALTKRFELGAKRELIKRSYPHVFNFDSLTESVKTLPQFHKALQAHAKLNHCLLKGEIQRDLVNESRADSTNNTVATDWLCLDIDGLPGITTVKQFIDHLPAEFHGVGHILQYSSSMGVDKTKGLSAHIFYQLDSQYQPSLLKEWLISLNHSIPLLANNLTLARSKCVLKWPLDISVTQNDKLIYIAPPLLGPGIKDTLRKPRIQYIPGKHSTLTPAISSITSDANARLTKTKINELREAEGLPPRTRIDEKTVSGIIVASAPGTAIVTQIRETDEFIYLNLNGGDSFGYYHPRRNPDILYNFKGEPNYAIKEFLPDYWKSLRKERKLKATALNYLAFTDVRTDTYYRGTHDANTDEYEIHPTTSLRRVTDFLAQHNQFIPENIPEWNVEFRFDDPTSVDYKRNFLNLYRESKYMHNTEKTNTKVLPPTIYKVIHHALGSDDESFNHFINWLAYILQFRTKSGIAWVLHGTQGTGKGVLFNHILAPLVGQEFVARAQLETFEKEFNSFMEKSVFILVDEVQISESRSRAAVMARLKLLISEPLISIRKMHTNQYSAINYSNFIFASNKHDPIEIDPDDRRFNVGKRQNRKLALTTQEIERIEGELPQFANYLMQCKVDETLARTPLANQTRKSLQDLTRNSVEAVADAVRNADFAFFYENRPSDEDPATLMLLSNASGLPTYLDAVRQLYTENKISRDSLRTLYFYLTATTFKTPHKASKFFGHKGLDMQRIRCNLGLTYGYLRESHFAKSAVAPEVEEWLTQAKKVKLKSVK